MEKNVKQRVYRWDWMKLALIFLVVFGHLLDRAANRGAFVLRLDYWIYLFHMPAFIFISGMFAKHNIQQHRYGHIFSLLWYYLLAKVILFIGQWLLNYPSVPTFSLFSESGIPWYLFAMFWFEIIALTLDRFDHRLVAAGIILVAMFAPYWHGLGDFLVLARVVGFMPYFYFGYLMDPQKLASQLEHRRWIGLILMVIAFVGVWFTFPHLGNTWGFVTSRLPYIKMGPAYLKYGPLMRLIFGSGVIVLIFSLGTIVPEVSGSLAGLGAKTLQIYIFHLPMIWIVDDVFHVDQLLMQLLRHTVIVNFLIAVLIVGLCVSWPITWITKHLFTIPRLKKTKQVEVK